MLRSRVCRAMGLGAVLIAIASATAGCAPDSVERTAKVRSRVTNRAKPGDVNGDGLADIALAGGQTGCASPVPWLSIPVAFSSGDGTFYDTIGGGATFTTSATQAGSTPVMGDFDGDGRADIALTRGIGWTTIPVAFSRGDGTFNLTNDFVQDFPTWSTQIGGHFAVAGDFDGDGRDDLALAGGNGWGTVPVAFSVGDGTFNVTNYGLADFPTWATQAWVVLAGDFNGDGLTDLALTGGNGWGTVPVAFSNGDGTFSVTNGVAVDSSTGDSTEFPTWAVGSGAVSGDFNGDGLSDIALVSGPRTGSAFPSPIRTATGRSA